MRPFGRAVALLLVLSPFVAFAADDKDHPELDKKTAEVMKKLGPLYKDAKSMRADAVIEMTVTPEKGDKQVVRVKATVEMQRPNLFSLRSKSDGKEAAGVDVVCDGKALFIHNGRMKQFTEGKAPKGLDSVGRAILNVGTPSTGMLYQNVLAEDPAEALLDGVTKGEHAGMEKVDGKETHHLKFQQEGLDWEIWVAAEGQPWVLKASSARSLPNAKVVLIETYTNWKLNAEPAKDAFTFTPPEGAKKVKSLGRPDNEG